MLLKMSFFLFFFQTRKVNVVLDFHSIDKKRLKYFSKEERKSFRFGIT